MKVAEWLTYSNMDHLKLLKRFYCETIVCDPHSKHEMIRILMQQMGRTSQLQRVINEITPEERSYLELLMFDNATTFTKEELIGKGRVALGKKEASPRSFVVRALQKGWIFPGYSLKNRDLYHIPDDMRKKLVQLLVQPVLEEPLLRPPVMYRNEEGQMVEDLIHFLTFLQRNIVRLTHDGAIYKQQQKQLLEEFFVLEKPLATKGPRFGFGRSFHMYPDRLSLLYDFALYQGYFIEDQFESLCLTELGEGKINNKLIQDGESIYHFWIRLYRRPIPQLPMVIRWISILADTGWIVSDVVYQAVEKWLHPYFYETKESLFQRVIQMMLHLGVIMLGDERGKRYLINTPCGKKWMDVNSTFHIQAIEEEFTQKKGKYSR